MTRRVLSVCVAVALLCGVAFAAGPGLRLPAVFSDPMVLQRERKAPVWGWAAPGKKVTVKVAAQEATAKRKK